VLPHATSQPCYSRRLDHPWECRPAVCMALPRAAKRASFSGTSARASLRAQVTASIAKGHRTERVCGGLWSIIPALWRTSTCRAPRTGHW
jgi:hypothetical protein